jgi:hypothetical protein
MKRLALLSVVMLALSSCADRERLNCRPTKNKALRGVVVDTTTTEPRYGDGGKCL